MPKLVSELKKLAARKCPGTVRHSNGKQEEGKLKRVLYNRQKGTVRLYLDDHVEKHYRGRRQKVQSESPLGRPIVFQLEHAEWGRSPGRLDIGFSTEDDEREYEFNLTFNTIL
jgi:hypothetical protein